MRPQEPYTSAVWMLPNKLLAMLPVIAIANNQQGRRTVRRSLYIEKNTDEPRHVLYRRQPTHEHKCRFLAQPKGGATSRAITPMIPLRIDTDRQNLHALPVYSNLIAQVALNARVYGDDLGRQAPTQARPHPSCRTLIDIEHRVFGYDHTR